MLVDMDDTGVITVRDLRRRYGGRAGQGFDAVRGITFSVRRGELFALLGTNGAGKTSTMEMLEGLARPAHGTVRILGRDPWRERSQVRSRMGIMLQEGGFPSDLTVAETGRMWAGTLSAPRPVAEALELVDLGHRARVALRSLSGGERRRLDLAMAILGRPEVLFLDEPTTGLDPESRRRTWLLIRELLAAGTTVLLTTHYLEEAQELADRLAIMHEGAIVRAGTLAQVAASESARISFELPENARESVPELAGTRVSVTGRHVLLETRDLQRTLGALLGWANSRDLVLGALDARSTSLEQAFHAVAAARGEPADGNGNDNDNDNDNAEDVAA
jgi:ABC-2 type transport system ATP-binding protein